METQKESVQPISPPTPTPSSNSTQIPGVLAIVQNALAFYKSRWKTFLGISLIPFVLGYAIFFLLELASAALREPLENNLIAWAFVILLAVPFLMIIGVWQFLATVFVIKDRQEEIGVKGAYKRAWSKIKSSIWISFLSSLVIFAGFLLLIVPGIIFSVWFNFSTYVLVDEGLTGLEAMKKSKEYVKGKFWAIVWRFLGFGLFSFGIFFGFFLLLIIPGIIFILISPKLAEILGGIVYTGASFVYAPLVIIYSYLVYQGLKISKSQPIDG